MAHPTVSFTGFFAIAIPGTVSAAQIARIVIRNGMPRPACRRRLRTEFIVLSNILFAVFMTTTSSSVLKLLRCVTRANPMCCCLASTDLHDIDALFFSLCSKRGHLSGMPAHWRLPV
jgi:hypothetical protein